MLRVGVLALQGDVAEHQAILRELDAQAVPVRNPTQLETINGLIIPGGESTAVGQFLSQSGLDKAIKKKAKEGVMIWGTCMGAILLSKKILENRMSVPALGLLDIRVRRNAYGRQAESFEQPVPISVLSGEPFPCVFIRSPQIVGIGKGVSVLAQFQGKPIWVEEKNVMASTFHPELTKDIRLHDYFIKKIRGLGN